MFIQVISRQEIFYHLFQKVPLKKRKKYADLLRKKGTLLALKSPPFLRKFLNI
jgi:hypothetical protein